MRACWLFVLGLAVLNGTDEGPEDWDSRYLRYFRYDLDAYPLQANLRPTPAVASAIVCGRLEAA